MIDLVVTLAILLIVMALAWWILSMIPLPPPIGQIAQVVLVVICAIVLIYTLLGLVGHGPYMLR